MLRLDSPPFPYGSTGPITTAQETSAADADLALCLIALVDKGGMTGKPKQLPCAVLVKDDSRANVLAPCLLSA